MIIREMDKIKANIRQDGCSDDRFFGAAVKAGEKVSMGHAVFPPGTVESRRQSIPVMNIHTSFPEDKEASSMGNHRAAWRNCRFYSRRGSPQQCE